MPVMLDGPITCRGCGSNVAEDESFFTNCGAHARGEVHQPSSFMTFMTNFVFGFKRCGIVPLVYNGVSLVIFVLLLLLTLSLS